MTADSLTAQGVTGCQLFDFRDEVGGGLPGWQQAVLGDATGVSEWLSAQGVIVYANSSDLYHGDDNGGFIYRTLAGYGDFRVEIPVPDQTDYSNSLYQKGGLMVRFGLDARAPRVMAMLLNGHPNGRSIQFDARAVRDGIATELASTVPAAGVDRLAIERRGARFVVEISTDDGASWSQPLGGLGGEVVLDADGDPQIGLAVSSGDSADDVAFVFPELLLCGEDEAPPPPPIEVVDGCLADPFDDGFVDSGWTLTALGDADQVAVGEDGELELTGDGSSLFAGARDDGAFLHRAVTGDFRAEITVDVGAMGPAGPYRKGGLMLRTGLDPGAPRVIAQLAPNWNDGGGPTLQFRYRAQQDGLGDLALGSNRFGVPTRVDLAIERRGDTLEVLYSFDERATWIRPAGGTGGAVTLSTLPETLVVGPNVVSYDPETVVAARFDDFELCRPGLVAGQVWWDQDGDARIDDAELLLPNVQVELRTDTNQPIFTTYTDTEGRYLFPRVDPGDYQVLIDSAIPIGGIPELTYDLDGTDNFETAFFSLDRGEQLRNADFGWRVAGAIPSGCVVDGFDDGQIDTGFSDPMWFATAFGDADQTSVDEAAGVLALSADGSSLYADEDHGLFVFHEMEGDFRVEVAVDGAAMLEGGPYRKGGLMLRPGLGSEEPRLIVQLVPYWNDSSEAALQFRYRAVDGGPGDIAWGSTVFGVPRQVRLAVERSGDIFTVEYSLDGGVTWQRPAGGSQAQATLAWPAVVLVGLDVVSYSPSTPATLVFDDYQACPAGFSP
ncbi:MAG: SdrD B-like domain-containing protein [Acidobacteriota bacterium]